MNENLAYQKRANVSEIQKIMLKLSGVQMALN